MRLYLNMEYNQLSESGSGSGSGSGSKSGNPNAYLKGVFACLYNLSTSTASNACCICMSSWSSVLLYMSVTICNTSGFPSSHTGRSVVPSCWKPSLKGFAFFDLKESLYLRYSSIKASNCYPLLPPKGVSCWITLEMSERVRGKLPGQLDVQKPGGSCKMLENQVMRPFNPFFLFVLVSGRNAVAVAYGNIQCVRIMVARNRSYHL